MPIVIPSKNIYSMENKKVISNQIDALEITTINASEVFEENHSLFESSIIPTNIVSNEMKTDFDSGFYQTSASNIISESACYAELQTKYLKDYTIQIPKTRKDGSFVESVENPKIIINYLSREEKISVSNVTKDGADITDRWLVSESSESKESNDFPEPTISTGRVPQGGNGSSSVEIIEENETNIGSIEDDGDSYSLTIHSLLVGLYTLEAGYAYQQAVDGINRNGNGTIKTYEPVSIEINLNGSIRKLDISENVIKLGGVGENTVNISRNSLIQTQNYFNGVMTTISQHGVPSSQYDAYEGKYSVDGIPSDDEFKMFQRFSPYDGGDELGEDVCVIYINNINQFGIEKIYSPTCLVSWENGSAIGTVQYTNNGDGNLNFLAIRYVGNADSMVYEKTFSIETTFTNAVKHNYQKTISDYKNGKDKIVILCSIGEYYDEQGNKVVSTVDQGKNMVIGNGEKVIVMAYNGNGEDVPVATKENEKPVVFRVIKTKYVYDGAVFQELTLQEVTNG